MLNLQKIIQDLKTQKINLLIDRKITAGYDDRGRASMRSSASSGSYASAGSRRSLS